MDMTQVTNTGMRTSHMGVNWLKQRVLDDPIGIGAQKDTNGLNHRGSQCQAKVLKLQSVNGDNTHIS